MAISTYFGQIPSSFHTSIERVLDYSSNSRIYQASVNIISQASIDIISVVVTAILLDTMGKNFLTHPSRFIARAFASKIYSQTILAPIIEEIVFRVILLRGIAFIQRMYNCRQKIKNLCVNDLSHNNSSFFIFKVYSSYVWMKNQGMQGLHFVQKKWRSIPGYRFQAKLIFYFSRMKTQMGQGIDHLQKKWNHFQGYQLTVEEEKEQLQLMWRVHVTSLIFTTTHLLYLSNTPASILRRSWTYLGGVIYGYTSEKYGLGAAIFLHSTNNMILLAARIFPRPTDPYFWLFIYRINRFVTSLLVLTNINQKILNGIRQTVILTTSVLRSMGQWMHLRNRQIKRM